MKNIFIYAGSKSARLADYILIKNPELFSNKVKYNIAIGRAIKTNWGRKSVMLLSKQIEDRNIQGADLNRELGFLLKKYNGGVELLERKLEGVQESEVKDLFKFSEKVKLNKVFNRLQEEGLDYYEIDSILNSENLEITDDFLELWIKRYTKVNENLIFNIIIFLEKLIEIDSTNYLLLRLAQAYSLSSQLGKARDSYFKYTVFYGSTPSINYVVGNNNKIFINKLFQRNESLIAHPLLDSKVATNFFNNHNEFIENYYTNTWKEVLKLDCKIREVSRKRLDNKIFDSDKNILFVTNANWNFLTTLIEGFQKEHSNIDVYDYSFFSKTIKSQDKSTYDKMLYSPLSLLVEEDTINSEYFRSLDPIYFQLFLLKHSLPTVRFVCGILLVKVISKYF